jgi:hypothetical protein
MRGTSIKLPSGRQIDAYVAESVVAVDCARRRVQLPDKRLAGPTCDRRFDVEAVGEVLRIARYGVDGGIAGYRRDAGQFDRRMSRQK